MNNLTTAVWEKWLKQLLRSIRGLIALAVVLHTHGVTLHVLVIRVLFGAILEFGLPDSLRSYIRL